jgi:hypothetical protein
VACQNANGGLMSGYHSHGGCKKCNSCEQAAPCQQCQPPSSSTPCDPPSKPVYCNSCNKGLIIVQQPGSSAVPPTALPPLATSVGNGKDEESSTSRYQSTTDVPRGPRTLVGTLQYNSKTNVWRLRHLGIGPDDQQGGEVVLRGIEPYANSLKDKLTVSIRGELSATTTRFMDFNVSEVNIVGQ